MLYQGNPVHYVAAEKLWADNHMREAGDQFAYEGRPTPAMLPVCEEGEKRSAEARHWETVGWKTVPLPSNEPMSAVAEEARAAAKAKAAKLKKTKSEDLA